MIPPAVRFSLRRPFLSLLLPLAFLAAAGSSGCRQQIDTAPGERTPPNPKAPAAYGPPAREPSREVARLRSWPDSPGTAGGGGSWTSSPLSVIRSELSPATLLHSSARRLDLFAGSLRSGLGAPTYIAWHTVNGPRTFKRNEPLDASHIEECWLLVWWSGAEGWTNWDAPCAVYLQHRPRAMRLDDDGLHLDFPAEAGDVVVLPLYGYEKLPQKGRNFLAEHGLTGRKVQTWDWPEVLRRDPLTRLRYWAAALREFPLACEESFSVDRARDEVTLRSRFTWHSIQDEWRTPRLKLAPIPPVLGHAIQLGNFPVRLSKGWFDLDYFTPSGPLLAVENVDEYDATFPVLQYVNEMELPEAAVAGSAREQTRVRLEELVRQWLAASVAATNSVSSLLGTSGPEEQQVAALLAAGAWVQAVAAGGAGLLAEAGPGLRPAVRDRLLEPLLGAPAAGPGQRLPWPQPLASAFLQTAWRYAQVSDDWDWVRQRWSSLRALFNGGVETHWAGVGRERVSDLGSEASACLAFARLAYRIGEIDSYQYACARFARELTLLHVRQAAGTDYYRRRQPFHSMAFMGEEVFLTSLQGGPGGWNISGPQYSGEEAGGRAYLRRWAGFDEAGLGRFCRDYLAQPAQRELLWLKRDRASQPPAVSPAGMELLLAALAGESPSGSAVPTGGGITPLEEMTRCRAVLQSAARPRYARLIPPGSPSPFVAGLEREATPGLELLTAVLSTEAPLSNAAAAGDAAAVPAVWPSLHWTGWKAPGGGFWTFGAIRDAGRSPLLSWKSSALNWNARVFWCEPLRAP